MSFNGPALSFDDEGSILFDGEKFIVNDPSKVPDNFNPGGRPVVGLPETHPGHPNNQAPTLGPFPTIPPGLHVPPSPTIGGPGYALPGGAANPSTETSPRDQSTGQAPSPHSDVQVSTGVAQRVATPDAGQAESEELVDNEIRPEISEAEIFDVCREYCQRYPEAMTALMNLIEGFDPDDDEQTLEGRVSNFLGLMGANDAFGHGDWYTTRLDPIVRNTATRIVDYYFDKVEPSQEAQIAASVSDEETMSDEQQVTAEAPQREPKRLNYHSLEHARKYIDGWDEAWTTEGDVSDLIIKKLADTYGIQVQEGFADLPIEDQLQEFLEFVYYHRESYYSRTGPYESPYPWYILVEDYDDFLPLLKLLKPAPLHGPEALADAFGFISEEHAVDYLRHHLELVYMDMGYDLPEDWSTHQDQIQLANMLYTVLEEIKLKRESDRDFDIEFGLDFKFQDAYGLQGSDVNRDLARLAGTHKLPDYSQFLFILSVIAEPVDYVITGIEVLGDIFRGDGRSALIRALIGFVPGAWGRFYKRFRSADEIVDSFRYFDKVDQRALSVSGRKLPDDLLNRGYPEQVVRALKSGETTRPVRHRDRSRRIPDDQLETSKDIGSRLQNDVADFMLQEGYLVEGLGPNTGAHRMRVYKDVGHKPSGHPDLVIWQALPDGNYKERYFDVYSPESVKLTTIEREIRDKASRQDGYVVLNLQRTTLDEKALSTLHGYVSKSRHLREVIIVDFVGETAAGVKLYKFVDIWTFDSAG